MESLHITEWNQNHVNYVFGDVNALYEGSYILHPKQHEASVQKVFYKNIAV